MVGTVPDNEDWIRRYHPAPRAPHRLLCLPHAGGSASYFFPVSRALSPGVDVAAVQYPGRQDRRREPLIGSVEELADRVVGALAPDPHRPLTLFGHSMGASIAFEVARRLERAGAPPAGLFVSGRRAPKRHRDEAYHRLSDDRLLAEVHRLSGTQADLLADDEVVQMVLPAIRNDYRAAETYRYSPGPDVSCPIVALVGDTDPKATVDEVRSWAEHTTGRFDLRVFSGGHFYLNQHQVEVMDLLRGHLTAAPAGWPG